MIFLGGTSEFHYGQVVLQIHLSVGQVDFLTKFDPWLGYLNLIIIMLVDRNDRVEASPYRHGDQASNNRRRNINLTSV